MKFVIVFVLLFSISNSYAVPEGQSIYQYRDVNGVTEFTDTPDLEKSLTRELTLKSPTKTQKTEGAERLEHIRAYNKDFSQRYYEEKKQQYESEKRNAKEEKERAKRKKEAHDKSVANIKSKHKRRKHLIRDRIREKKGKPAHPE